LKYILISLAALVPCFWLPRIQAGDLSSHVYNAWLAQLVAHGSAPGLRIEPQWTNVLFDLELSALWGLGPALAAKIAVAIAVLIFVWGAFAFARAVSAREPWFLLPVFAMLAYGWVFHTGLFNFYLSLALSLWALALAWHTSPTRLAGATAILALALTAHALPVAWTAFVLFYRAVCLVLRPRYRPLLILVSFAALSGLHWLIRARFDSRWSIEQAHMMSGSDQVSVYGGKYQWVQLALLVVWVLLAVRVYQTCGWKRLAVSVPLHVALITAAAVTMIPNAILLPGYGHRLVFIAERMSLAIAVSVCALLAAARPRAVEMSLMTAACIYFFGFLYLDGRAVNRIEDRLERAVAQVPPGSRVVSALNEPVYRVDPVLHLIDRVCVGRCFSYANYEPGTKQFRIRAEPGNPVVVATYKESYEMQIGRYKVKLGDLPLWGVFAAGDEFVVRPLEAQESFQMARLLK
jgi:hypothetical protein